MSYPVLKEHAICYFLPRDSSLADLHGAQGANTMIVLDSRGMGPPLSFP